MPSNTANVVLFATRIARYPEVTLASGSTATDTEVATGATTYGSILLDILIASSDASARVFEIKIGPSGGAGSITRRCKISVPANSGDNGTTAVASLAALAPQLFSLDLAGNRCIGLETSVSIYMKNTTTTAGQITFTPVLRDYTP